MANPAIVETSRPVAGVILAGGLSRRMGGGDKSLLEVGGRSMLTAVIERLECQAQPLVLNVNGDPTRFAHFHLPIVADPIDGHIGPLAGVLGGMRWARENSTARQIVTVPADTPFLPQDLVERFLDGIGDAEIAIARSRGRSHPVVGLWPIEMADALECWLRDVRNRKTETWVRSRRLVEIAFDGDEEFDPFFNVNTPQDAIAAATRAKRAR
jgi:molybdopterin-guanine dinucleotide biosynthesis protein A